MPARHNVSAAALGQTTPAESGEAVELGSGDGFGEQGTADNGDCAAKVVATTTARAALAGVQLTQCTDGSWCASRWGWSRPLADVAAVESFLRLVGAPA